MTRHRTTSRRVERLRLLSWILAAVAFAAGPIIGMNVNAQLGAGIWISSAVMALLPFASHRDY